MDQLEQSKRAEAERRKITAGSMGNIAAGLTGKGDEAGAQIIAEMAAHYGAQALTLGVTPEQVGGPIILSRDGRLALRYCLCGQAQAANVFALRGFDGFIRRAQ